MRQKSARKAAGAVSLFDAIRDIRRATRRHFSAEEKIRVVLAAAPEETVCDCLSFDPFAFEEGWSGLVRSRRRPA